VRGDEIFAAYRSVAHALGGSTAQLALDLDE
jgi:hypothetical protein